MKLNAQDTRDIIASMRNELNGLKDVECVEGYAAEDEIGEAVNHLDSALVDIERGINEE